MDFLSALRETFWAPDIVKSAEPEDHRRTDEPDSNETSPTVDDTESTPGEARISDPRGLVGFLNGHGLDTILTDHFVLKNNNDTRAIVKSSEGEIAVETEDGVEIEAGVTCQFEQEGYWERNENDVTIYLDDPVGEIRVDGDRTAFKQVDPDE